MLNHDLSPISENNQKAIFLRKVKYIHTFTIASSLKKYQSSRLVFLLCRVKSRLDITTQLSKIATDVSKTLRRTYKQWLLPNLITNTVPKAWYQYTQRKSKTNASRTIGKQKSW